MSALGIPQIAVVHGISVAGVCFPLKLDFVYFYTYIFYWLHIKNTVTPPAMIFHFMPFLGISH